MWPKTDGRAGRDVEKLSRRSQRTRRKLGCQGTRHLVFREGILWYHIEVSPVSRCWCPIEAREALGGADVGEVVDEGAPDPFAGRKKPVPVPWCHCCWPPASTLEAEMAEAGEVESRKRPTGFLFLFASWKSPIRNGRKFMYMQKKPPVWGDPYIFLNQKHQGHKKSSQKHPQKNGTRCNQQITRQKKSGRWNPLPAAPGMLARHRQIHGQSLRVEPF